MRVKLFRTLSCTVLLAALQEVPVVPSVLRPCASPATFGSQLAAISGGMGNEYGAVSGNHIQLEKQQYV